MYIEREGDMQKYQPPLEKIYKLVFFACSPPFNTKKMPYNTFKSTYHQSVSSVIFTVYLQFIYLHLQLHVLLSFILCCNYIVYIPGEYLNSLLPNLCTTRSHGRNHFNSIRCGLHISSGESNTSSGPLITMVTT